MKQRRSASVVLLWTCLVLVVAFFIGQAIAPDAALYASVLSRSTIDWLGSLPKVLFPLLTSIWAWAVAHRFEAGNPARRGWALLAVGVFGLFLGQATLLAYYLRGRAEVFPSIGDFFFVAGTLAVIMALASLVRAYATSGFDMGPPRQLVLVGASAAVISAALVVPLLLPVARAAAPPLEKTLNLIYPTLDLVMLIPAVLLLWISYRFRGGKVAPVWTALVAGTLFMAAGDIMYGYFSNLDHQGLAPALDAVYILAYGCLAASVLQQRELLAG